MKTLLLRGTITAITGISYTTPFGKAKDGVPALPTIGGRLYLSASSIRSTIRHSATNAIIEHLPKKPGLDDYFLMALGGIKNAKETEKKTDEGSESMAAESGEDASTGAEEQDSESARSASAIMRNRYARQRNPMATLFGTMSHDVPGSLYCAHATAVDDAVIPDLIRHVRADDFLRTPDIAEALDESAVTDFVARQAQAAQRSKLRAQIKALKAAMIREKAKDKKAQINEEIKQIDAELKSFHVVQISQPNLAYYQIPPGTAFSHEFVLAGVSDLEIALFLEGLNGFAMNPFLGGKHNHGLGRVKAQWNVSGRDAGERVMRDMGSVAFDGSFNPLELSGEVAGMAAFDKVVQAIQEGTLDFSEAGLAKAA